MVVPHRASKTFSGISKKNSGCCRQRMGPNSTSVMPGIEMARAFSALASPVRFPSPLGWAGMMGAVGAARFTRLQQPGRRCSLAQAQARVLPRGLLRVADPRSGTAAL